MSTLPSARKEPPRKTKGGAQLLSLQGAHLPSGRVITLLDSDSAYKLVSAGSLGITK